MHLTFVDQEDPNVEATITLKIEDFDSGETLQVSVPVTLGEEVRNGKKTAVHVTRRSTRRNFQEAVKDVAKAVAAQISDNKPSDGWETVV